jgi:hypothetical protein
MAAAVALAGSACPAPPETGFQVDYRDGLDGTGMSGERGTVKISEVLWSGSVRETSEGPVWDPRDQFIELRNESSRPMDVSGWYLEIQGVTDRMIRLPKVDKILAVSEHLLIATKSDGCFPDPDVVLPDFYLPYGERFQVTLLDIDERLIEGAGHRDMPPFAGGYDLVMSRSMEMAQLMFGVRGNRPHAWHHWTDFPVDVPNQTRISEDCRRFTGASPGLPNSPDYSGTYASGGLD